MGPRISHIDESDVDHVLATSTPPPYLKSIMMRAGPQHSFRFQILPSSHFPSLAPASPATSQQRPNVELLPYLTPVISLANLWQMCSTPEVPNSLLGTDSFFAVWMAIILFQNLGRHPWASPCNELSMRDHPQARQYIQNPHWIELQMELGLALLPSFSHWFGHTNDSLPIQLQIHRLNYMYLI